MPFDFANLCALFVCGYLAGIIGNLIALVIVAIRTPWLEGRKIYTTVIMTTAIVSMTPIKIVVSFIVALGTLYLCATIGQAAMWAMIITGVLGFGFTFLVGTDLFGKP